MNHDITHCTNEKCKDKEKCYRFLAYQEIKERHIEGLYSMFRPQEPPTDKTGCEYFTSIELKR